MHAASDHATGNVKLLISAGADLNIEDIYGNTALTLARYDKEIYEIIEAEIKKKKLR